MKKVKIVLLVLTIVVIVGIYIYLTKYVFCHNLACWLPEQYQA